MVEFRLDNAGYRSGMVNGPKPPGAYRIVLIGSSVALGERVPFERTLAALLPKKLSQQSGRKIELYNEGMAYGFARNTDLRFQDALAVDPDIILWLLTPLDVGRADFDYVRDSQNHAVVPDGRWEAAKRRIRQFVRAHAGGIIFRYALRHWIFEIQSPASVRLVPLAEQPRGP